MDKAESSPNPPAVAPRSAAQPLASMRELLDELVLVFVLVMFLKTFLVEHYKIPSGSMTPTLLGGQVAYTTLDGRKALAYWNNVNYPPLVYTKQNGRYLLDEEATVDTNELNSAGLVHEEFDHVLVNRLAYWFHQPRRGDIVVFKVPPEIFKPEAPIYIKRLTGQPGDTLTFTPEGRLVANGQRVEQPGFFQTQHYLTQINDNPEKYIRPDEEKTHLLNFDRWQVDKIHVPADKAYVFGDNSTVNGSWDSRYWGGVPLNNFKGRAFVRVWPLSQAGFLH